MLDLITIARRDRAVVISSHILADVQRVADTVGVLREGRLIYQGPVADLIDRHTRPSWRLHLRSGAERAGRRGWPACDVGGRRQAQRRGFGSTPTSLRAGETLLPAEIAASGAGADRLQPGRR